MLHQYHYNCSTTAAPQKLKRHATADIHNKNVYNGIKTEMPKNIYCIFSIERQLHCNSYNHIAKE